MRRFLTVCFMIIAFSLTGEEAFAQLYDAVVAKDGSAKFSTIQDAINSIRDYKPEGRQRILVKKGVYEEKVIVPSYKTNITLVGEDRDSTIIIWHDHANMRTVDGWPPFTLESELEAHRLAPTQQKRKIGTFQSYTLRVDGPGFECENMTIVNDAMSHWNPNWYADRKDNQHIGQAVTVHVEADKTVFRNCKLLGFQDTVFNGNGDSRQVFDNCYIEGTVDFIFGPATCWFESCHLHAISNGYLTAASTPAEHPYGYVFSHCRVTADSLVDHEYLGRPWRNHAAVIFSECDFCGAILPEGWHNWSDPAREKTSRYREYKCTGAGADFGKRVAWSRQLTDDEYAQLTLETVLNRPGDAWASQIRPVDFYQAASIYYDFQSKTGTPYVAATLESETMDANLEKSTEPLVVRLDGVDCTTFVEYVSAAILGRVPVPTAGDSILKRFVQALRYRKGVRGNYATRKHYLTEWIADNEAQGLMTELTAQMPGAKRVRKPLNFMSQHASLYRQLAVCPALVEQVRATEEHLSTLDTYYLPANQIRKNYAQLRDGDIVAFVTKTNGLDVTHVGFVYGRNLSEPHLLHASSAQGQVVVSDKTLADYVSGLKGCLGIRVVRLNK